MSGQGGRAALPGTDVPMTREELRDTLGGLIHGHSRHDSTEWDLDQAMSAVDAHIDFLAEQAQGQTSPIKGDHR